MFRRWSFGYAVHPEHGLSFSTLDRCLWCMGYGKLRRMYDVGWKGDAEELRSPLEVSWPKYPSMRGGPLKIKKNLWIFEFLFYSLMLWPYLAMSLLSGDISSVRVLMPCASVWVNVLPHACRTGWLSACQDWRRISLLPLWLSSARYAQLCLLLRAGDLSSSQIRWSWCDV